MADSSESLQQTIDRLVRADVRSMAAYHVPDASGMLKLDAMENPFAWPGELQARWLQCLKNVEINRYPDPRAESLIDLLKQQQGIDSESSVLLGNGSDEIIQMLIQAVATDDSLVLAPEPTFVMYKVLADINRVNFCGVPLDENFQLDMDAMLKVIMEKQPALIFLACPNNPTGNLWPETQLEQIVQAANGLVIVDEAYTAFTDYDALSLLGKYNNVLVMRTLSKVGLAGLRLGFLVGKPEWIAEIDKIRMPYNINVLTRASAEFALQNFDHLRQQTEELRRQREQQMQKLQSLDVFDVFPSEANFILLRCRHHQAVEVFGELKEQGILIKNLHGGNSLLDNCLRITVGDNAQNEKLFNALQKICCT